MQRRTKIIATIGPASESVEIIEQLIRAGMDFARLNFAHGTHESHAGLIDNIRVASRNTGKPVEIIGDLHGSKIRLGKLVSEIEVVRGQKLILRPGTEQTDSNIIPVGYKSLTKTAKVGDTLLLDDGLVELRVVEVRENEVLAEVVVGGVLKSYKGVNFPKSSLDMPFMTEKDKADLDFAVKQNLDHVSLSFVKEPADVERLREMILAHGQKQNISEDNLPYIIAKMERKEALAHLSDIPRVADAVMIDRGDLGSEIEPWHVPFLQKVIVRECRKQGKPVIVATQMMNSMITHPKPTRAEINDVSLAVIDRSDMVMLSGETAAGKYPVEAVETMRRIIEETEKLALDYIL